MDRTLQTFFALIIGLFLIVLAILGLLGGGVWPFGMTHTQVFLYLLFGAFGVVCAVWVGGRASRVFSRITGVVFLVIVLLGFLQVQSTLAFTLDGSIVHGVLGVVGLVIGVYHR